jgi:hypothetical protein
MKRITMVLTSLAALMVTAAPNDLMAQKGTTVHACSLLSAAEIKSITRRNDLATGKPRIEENDVRSNCIYPGAQNLGVTVRSTSKLMYERARDMYKNAPATYKLVTFERASGIGQDTYVLTHNDTQNVVKVIALVGEREVEIALEKAGRNKSQVLALAKAAAAKLR